MMKAKSCLLTLVGLAMLGLPSIPAYAMPIAVSQAQNITSNGQNFEFNFNGLMDSDGTGGIFSFTARGDYTTPLKTAVVRLESLAGSLQLSSFGGGHSTP